MNVICISNRAVRFLWISRASSNGPGRKRRYLRSYSGISVPRPPSAIELGGRVTHATDLDGADGVDPVRAPHRLGAALRSPGARLGPAARMGTGRYLVSALQQPTLVTGMYFVGRAIMLSVQLLEIR